MYSITSAEIRKTNTTNQFNFTRNPCYSTLSVLNRVRIKTAERAVKSVFLEIAPLRHFGDKMFFFIRFFSVSFQNDIDKRNNFRTL